MKIYQVHFISSDHEHGAPGESLGYGYFPSMRAAAAAHKESNAGGAGGIRKIEVSLTRLGILKALNLLASHPDNG